MLPNLFRECRRPALVAGQLTGEAAGGNGQGAHHSMHLPLQVPDGDLDGGQHRSGDVTVCDVYPRSPRMIVISTVRAGEKASSARPIAVGWAGTVAAELNEVAGRGPGTFSM